MRFGMLGCVAIIACGNPHTEACEAYQEAATACFAAADAEVPAGVTDASCDELANGAEYYTCVADAYEAADCSTEGAEALNAAVLACELTP